MTLTQAQVQGYEGKTTTFTLTVTSADGCPAATSSVTLTVNKLPSSDGGTATAEHTITLCQGNVAQLNGYYENGITGTWTGKDGGVDNATLHNTTVTVPADGTAHTYTWKYKKSGCPTDVVETWSVTNQSAHYPTAASDYVVCGDTDTKPLGSSNNGTWTFVSGPSTAAVDASNGAVSGMTNAGTYKFQWTGKACGTDVTKDVTIYKFKADVTATLQVQGRRHRHPGRSMQRVRRHQPRRQGLHGGDGRDDGRVDGLQRHS